MTTGARFAAAGVCFGAGFLAAWAMQQHVRVPRATAPMPTAGSVAPAGIEAQGSPAVLWVLAVGVSRYHDAALNLRFADSDADTVAAAFGRQAGGPLYRDVRTQVLLNEQATREAILAALEGLLRQVRVDDVVLLFLAGHGVQDTSIGSYYFLPSPATADSIRTHGLRMTDVDELLRILRSNVRGVVTVLDTCHAGALRSSRSMIGDELVAPMPAGDGFFLFAASRPGEESKEDADLGHGAFTYAFLEGLAGAADADGDGVLPVSELFGYVARRVPALTGGQQHPYYKIEGTDLMLAALLAGPVATMARQGEAPRSSLAVNTIGVTEFRNLRGTPEDDWIGKAIRVAFNTELSKVRSLRVYVPQVIDRTSGAQRADYLAAAHQLGIRRLVTGSYHVVGGTLRIDAEIIDTAAGVQEASDSVQGERGDFFMLQKQLVRSMLSRWRVQPSSEEERQIQKEGSTDVDAYRLLLETEGVMKDRTPPLAAAPTAAPQATPAQHSDLSLPEWLLAPIDSTAHAAEPPPNIATAVRQIMEAFRQALEHKDAPRLASLYVTFSEKHRAVLEAYLHNADELTVEFADMTMEIRPAGVLVTYTRTDRFLDHASRRPVRLEARLARLIVRENQTWKLGDAQ